MAGIYRKYYNKVDREEKVYLSKIKNFLKNIRKKEYLIKLLLMSGVKNKKLEERFLSIQYKKEIGKELHLDNPVTYTEKLQWLKLYDRRSVYTKMVDKYEVKKFVSEKIGSQYIIPLLGVWDSANKIDFESLPERFVLKTTHDSGGIIICKDKNNLNKEEVQKKLQYFLDRKYYFNNMEWPYKNVKPRIIAEKYMEDSETKELRDYKFFTFNGEPKVLYIAQGRGGNEATVADFFDMEFNHLPFTIDHDMSETLPQKPKNFELMKKLATQLSKGTPQLRVDFYEVDGDVFFGEMTFFHCSGFAAFHPEEWDYKFGEWVNLPEKIPG